MEEFPPVVLLLHADPGRAAALARPLEQAGMRVLTFTDAGDGMRNVVGADLVVLDISLSGEGPELCRKFRTSSPSRGIPILALAERAVSEREIGEILSAGAMDILSPPITPSLLLARVGNLVRIHRDEIRLKETENRYRRMFASSHYGYFLSTREGRFLEVNDALLNILGYTSREEVMKLRLPDDLYVHPGDRELLQHIIEKKGFVKDFRVDFKRKDGSKVTILLTANLYKDPDGKTLGYEGFNIPLTDLDTPARFRYMKWLLRPFRRMLGQRRNFLSVARISELVANQYEKVEELSEGFYTSVWKGRDVLGFEEGPLVIKISKSEAINPRLLLEAQVMRSLAGHPGVPELLDVARHRGRTVIVTRYVEGKPLSELLPIEDHRTRDRIAYQIMDVTAHLHDQNVVHRDIKPNNIIVRPDGTIALLDYGIVRRMGEMETSATIIGTRPYMSPEQVNGRSERRSDVWALGVVLYQIYTGRLPFSGNTEIELMENIMRQEPPTVRSLDPTVSAQMESAIIHALRKRPEGRFHSGGDMRDSILALVPDFRENVGDLLRQPEVPGVLVP